MRYFYYCNSIYQIINAMKLHLYRRAQGHEGDILIQRSFSGWEDVSGNLRAYKIFDNVYTFEKDRKKKSLKDKIEVALFPSAFLRHRFDLEVLCGRYDILCIPKINKFLSFVWRANRKAKIEYFEEGAGSYFEATNHTFDNIIYDFLHKIFNFGKTFADFNEIYLNVPEMLSTKALIGKRIPPIDILDCSPFKSFDELLINVFEKKEVHKFAKINWISQKTSIENYMTNDESFLELLKPYSDFVLYRPHPRYNEAGGNDFKVDDINEPFEVKTILDENINEKIFISYFSTACLVPKLLFNKEPYLIFLYKTWNKPNQNIDEVVSKFQNLYTDPRKIFVINNKFEFEEIINTLL